MPDNESIPVIVKEIEPLPLLWARWSALAAVNIAVDFDVHFVDGAALASDNGGGTWAQLVRADRDRGVLFGWDRDYTRTTDHLFDDDVAPIDMLAGAPDWLSSIVDDPELWWRRTRRAYGVHELGFVYWWEHDAWHHAPYPTEGLADGLVKAVDAVLTVEDAATDLCDLLEQGLEYEPADDEEHEAIIQAGRQIVVDAESSRLDTPALATLLDRIDTADVPAALAMARQLGIARPD
jgi:hypothetical protein